MSDRETGREQGGTQKATGQPGTDQPGSDQRGSDQRGSDQRGSDQRGTEQKGAVQRVQKSTGQRGTEPDSKWAARITFLRSRAAVARAEVTALEAMHRDPADLEDLLANASPDEVALAEAVEHRISERVAAARQLADAAEADYERAVLDGADLRTDRTDTDAD